MGVFVKYLYPLVFIVFVMWEKVALFFYFNSQIFAQNNMKCTRVLLNIYDGAFCENRQWISTLESFGFFTKKLHQRCLTGFKDVLTEVYLGPCQRSTMEGVLTLSWRISLSYRNQSTDLQSKCRALQINGLIFIWLGNLSWKS